MATLETRLRDLATAIATKFNAIKPQLLPAGGTTGQVLKKTSGTNYDAAWGDVAGGGAVGAHAVMPIPSGKFAQLALVNAFNSTAAIAAGNQWYYPFLPARNLTIDALAAEVTTLIAGGNAFIAIYGSDANGKPTGAPLSVTGSLSTATTGSKLGVLGANQALVAGTLYFVSIYSPTGTATWRVLGAGAALMLPSLETAANTAFYHYNGTAAMSGAVPAVTESASNPAHIRLRVA